MSSAKVIRPSACLKCGAALSNQNRSGYCRGCYATSRRCADDGCANWITGNNRHGYCRQHYKLGDTLARFRWAELADLEG